jgi:hypothetical protein
MQTHDILFTPTEAAVLTGLTLKAVNNAIDKKTISAVSSEEGGRLLDARALVSLALERRLADRVAPELRRQAFDALASSPRNTVSLEGGLLKIDLREPRREVATSLRDLRWVDCSLLCFSRFHASRAALVRLGAAFLRIEIAAYQTAD